MTEKRIIGPSVETVPAGDNRTRLVCPDCGYIEYANPKIVVGAVCFWQTKILLCKRAIAPSLGLWTIPAGFMELGETTSQGACREVWEEAQARVLIEGLIGIYEIPHISQVNVIYRAAMATPEFAPGPESEEVDLFLWDNIPWDALAFPSVRWSLEHFRAGGHPRVHAGVTPTPIVRTAVPLTRR
jgi:ADP-ribose pyrophosphatase YjhB (NUDIX family)